MGDMMKRILATVAAALITGASGGAAQQAPQAITFDEAVSVALRQSSAIARSDNAQELNALTVTDAKMQFLPDLRLSTSGSQDLQGSAVSGAGQSMNARLSSSVTLFDGFARVAGLRSAELSADAGQLDAARTRQEVVFSVISGFLTLIEAREQLGVAEDNVAAQTEREREIGVLVERGARPMADLYQQRATLAGAHSTVVEARRAQELAEVALVQALRLDAAGEYDFVAPELGEPARIVELDVAQLVEQAVQRRPDLAALAAREAAAEQGVRAAQASRLPTVSLSGSYGASYSSAADAAFTDQLDASRSGSLSLSLSLPLFDGLSTSRAVERANIQVENARLTVDEQRQQVALEVRRAVLDLESAVARLESADARVEAARQALTATEARYDAGVATLFEVTQARASFVDAESAQVRARYTLLFQDHVLDYYTGALDAAAALGA